jgi:beta-glucosidase
MMPKYLNKTFDAETRAKDLVSRMTIEEKTTQMLHDSLAVERLGIKKYCWWNEALHGVARAGVATVFPQAIGLAAMFDDEFLNKVADVISTEARAKHNEFQKNNDTDMYKGLTFWAPNINIFRDPRWGRGHETYGEDPYLTARCGVAFIKGMQGDDPNYLKTAACAKHFAVHSGPEEFRHSFNAVVSLKDLYETYLPAFEEAVKEAKVEAIMGAYNRVNGEPCCGSKTLLKDILREKWGFEGHIVSDCWAIKDFHEGHGVTTNVIESVALALKNGLALNCGNLYAYLLTAMNQNLISECDIDKCVISLMKTRIKLGMFDEQGDVPFNSIPFELNDCKEHKEINLLAAKKSMVLLKNDGILPLQKSKIKNIAVVGPNSNSRAALVGNYHGTASRYITALEGLQDYLEDDVAVTYAEGCHLFKDRTEPCANADDRLTEAKMIATKADIVLLCLGLDETLEGEEGDTGNAYSSGDKADLNLPTPQEELLAEMLKLNKPLIVALFAGSALAINLAHEKANAIIDCWYPGATGGKALAEILFGDFSPCGRLPITFYKTTEELPSFEDYSMENRTYRFMKNEPLYPFGYGLSYSKFIYSNISVNKTTITVGKSVVCKIIVKNIGNIDSYEVVQLYLTDNEASERVPVNALKGFQCIFLKQAESKEVGFTLTSKEMSWVDKNGDIILEKGKFTVYMGGSQPDNRSFRLTGNEINKIQFEVV